MTPWQERTSGPGIHSIPEMHTTHKHVEQFSWKRDESLRQSWKYQSGQLPPNYPVPAIPVYVDLLHGPVVVSDRYRSEVYYCDGICVKSIWNGKHLASKW